MSKYISVITRLALFVLGVGCFVGSLWLLVRYFAYGDNHPLNVMLGVFSVAPIMSNMTEISWFESSLLRIFCSLLTAAMIYTGLGSLAMMLTQELSFLIEAGSFKKYRELERLPAKPVSGVTKMMLTIVRPPK